MDRGPDRRYANFVAGGRAWGTLIALSDHGRLVVGVVSAPALGGRWWATVGVGAWAQRTGQAQRELTVTSAADLDSVRWVCYPSLESMNPSDRVLVRPLIERCGLPITPTTHGALMVAEGEADFCVQLSGGPWNFAAFAVIVETAGGAFSYLDGSTELRPRGRASFTNGAPHPVVLAAVGGRPERAGSASNHCGVWGRARRDAPRADEAAALRGRNEVPGRHPGGGGWWPPGHPQPARRRDR